MILENTLVLPVVMTVSNEVDKEEWPDWSRYRLLMVMESAEAAFQDLCDGMPCSLEGVERFEQLIEALWKLGDGERTKLLGFEPFNMKDRGFQAGMAAALKGLQKAPPVDPDKAKWLAGQFMADAREIDAFWSNAWSFDPSKLLQWRAASDPFTDTFYEAYQEGALHEILSSAIVPNKP